MTLRIWQQFSCNNSSSYRLVARFTDPVVASETANELARFLRDHAAQADARAPEDWDLNTAAELALAETVGLAWHDDVLIWGGGGSELVGDEPSVAAEDGTLVLYHGYCNGFGDMIPRYLVARGAHVVEDETMGEPTLSLLFVPPRDGAALDRELDQLFSQLGADIDEEVPFRAPWRVADELYGAAVGFRDPGAVGLHFPCTPRDVVAIRQWLGGHGVERISIALCEDDAARFAAIAKARCTACDGTLEYLDPRLHDIEAPQLACRACGGLYEPATFGA